ncbi:hypothetical protein KEM54_000890, partial [Ascosphaera aggregata]
WSPSSTIEVERVYNLVTTEEMGWNEFLKELSMAGLQFKTVSYGAWREKLVESEKKGQGKLNPAVKLIEHFDMAYGGAESGGLGAASFEIERVQKVSEVMRKLPSLKDGLVAKFLANWVTKWEKQEREAAVTGSA